MTTQTALHARIEGFDIYAHLQRQREWSERTFGPGARDAGVIDHIRKELREIEADPTDITEWIDVVILALDGSWRAGASPEQIIATIVAKQTKNEGRVWPDWRTADSNKGIEHVKPGCDKCAHCGMDMDLEPFCVQVDVIEAAKAKFNEHSRGASTSTLRAKSAPATTSNSTREDKNDPSPSPGVLRQPPLQNHQRGRPSVS